MENTITGQIKLINDTQTFTSGFTKRQFVIITEDKFPQDIPLDFMKDKCTILDSFKVGDQVEVAYNLNGSEYKGKHYVNLVAWKITHLGEHQDRKSAPIPTTNTLKDEMPDFDNTSDCPF